MPVRTVRMKRVQRRPLPSRRITYWGLGSVNVTRPNEAWGCDLRVLSAAAASQVVGEEVERVAAVGPFSFLFGGELGEGLSGADGLEDGVEAEPLGASGRHDVSV